MPQSTEPFQPHRRDVPLSYARVCVSHAEVVLPHGYGYMSSPTNVFKLLPVKLLMKINPEGRYF